MTHKDIYTKFMIEYDKANVTSSYPSLTEYEVATVLDKAYNALIAQKVTGNNTRRASFETDVKAISDLAPLVVHTHSTFFEDNHTPAVNIKPYRLPEDFNYYVQSYLNYRVKENIVSDDRLLETEVYSPEDYQFEDYDPDAWVKHIDVYYNETTDDSTSSNAGSSSSIDETGSYTKGMPYDNKKIRLVPVRLVPHYVAEKFFTSAFNMPWVKIPVCYIEQNTAYVVYDLLNPPVVQDGSTVHLTYIKKPNTFVKDLSLYNGTDGASFFDCPDDATDSIKSQYEFECNGTVAEELISLAVTFALENVESQRLNSKLNMRGLEA